MFRMLGLVLIGIVVGVVLLISGAGKARAQSEIDFGEIEKQLRVVADQDTAAFMDALKLAAKDISPLSERDGFVARLVAAVFPGRGYEMDEPGIEQWERLRAALAAFRGRAGGLLDGQEGDVLFLTIRGQLEVIPPEPEPEE